jgi:DNA-binding MarR family transcriptional regulator
VLKPAPIEDQTSPVAPSQDDVKKVELQLEAFMPYRLNVLAATVSEGLARVYSIQFGIDIPSWRIIATLGQLGSTTAKEIGQHTHMHKTKVSRAITDLEKRGLVRRSPNPGDRREAFVSLINAGRVIYEGIVPLAKGYQTQLLAVLTEQEQQVLDKALFALSAEADRLLAGSFQD